MIRNLDSSLIFFAFECRSLKILAIILSSQYFLLVTVLMNTRQSVFSSELSCNLLLLALKICTFAFFKYCFIKLAFTSMLACLPLLLLLGMGYFSTDRNCQLFLLIPKLMLTLLKKMWKQQQKS